MGFSCQPSSEFNNSPYAASRAGLSSRKPDWRQAVDECRLLTSLAYHLLRKWHGLEELPYLGQELAYILEDPSLVYV